MQTVHVYSATSLSQVMRQLVSYRLTGVLTIRRAVGPWRDEVSVVVLQGRATRVRWGLHEEEASESLLRWLNGWGEIHFVFHAREPQRQLPAPLQPARQEQFKPQNTTRASHLPPPSQPAHQQPAGYQNAMHASHLPPPMSTSVTRPLPAIATAGHNTPVVGPPVAGSSSTAPEVNIPVLTATARDYALTNIPRYDRTIFLLINGRRTITELAQLTRRSPAEVSASLYRLRALQLIEIAL